MAKKAKAKKAKAKAKKPAVKKTVSKSAKTKVAKKAVVKKAVSKPIKKSAKPVKTKTAKTQTTKSLTKPVSKVTDWQSYLAPLYDRVLLQKEKQELLSKGGLYLGEADASSAYAKAKVLAVGKGLLSKKGQVRPLDVSEGDTVMYSAYAGSTIKVDGQDLVIVKEEEILGIMEN